VSGARQESDVLFRRKQRAARAVAPDAAWQVRESRFHESREGQPLEIAGRVAICPHGHRRAIPTRFDRPLVELRCAECGRAYPFPQGD
jgi:hypothetical protein